MSFLGSKKGVRCETMPDGVTQKCRIYKAEKGEKLASGSEWNMVIDENCDPHFPGGMDILEDDEEIVNKVIKQSVAACRKGIH